MMTHPRFTDLAASLPSTVPFVGAEVLERARGRPFTARIGANESVFGPSPKAQEAMAAADIWKYPDSASHDLRQALSETLGTVPDNIVVGSGIDGLLGSLVRLIVAPGDAVVTSDGAYPTFNYHVAGYGGVLHKVPYKGDAEDPEALIECAAQTNAKLVYLANPDNPMGSWVEAGRIDTMLAALPKGCLLVLDEAYVEFAPASAVPPIEAADPRLIRFRTFSKAHGLAGARIGYGIAAPDLIAAFDKVRDHFGVNRAAQDGALAALLDAEWIAHVRREVEAARARIAAIAAAEGLSALPSATNFVAVDCGRDGDFARRVLEELLARDIFVRMPYVAPLDRCVRLSAGRPADLDALKAALGPALAAARAYFDG